MKSLKTFNLDQDVINILKLKPNKSQYVCRAVRQLHNKDSSEDIPLMEATDTDILTELSLRFDVHSPQYQLLQTIKSLL
tara:strand:- start:263 stop:499 length:237 start_codon:yes stop_codon:yes gene_type:complete